MLALLSVQASAYSLHPVGRHQPSSVAAASARSAVQACAVATAISTPDAAKIFGRLAEPQLYLDATVGVCCHSACSDCEWRSPDGGYRCALRPQTAASPLDRHAPPPAPPQSTS